MNLLRHLARGRRTMQEQGARSMRLLVAGDERVKQLIEQVERGEITREDLLDLMDPHTVNITE